MAPLNEAQTDSDHEQCNQHRYRSLVHRGPSDLVETQGCERDHVSEDRHRVLSEDRSKRRIGGDLGFLKELSVVTAGPGRHLACRLAHRQKIEDCGAREDDIGDQVRVGGAGMEQLFDALPQRECRTTDEDPECRNEGPEVRFSSVAKGMLVIGSVAAAELCYEEKCIVG